MTDEVKAEDAAKAVGSYTISLDIAGRRIQLSGYILDSDTKEGIMVRMTEAQECIDYQLLRADTKSAEGKLKMSEMALEQVIEENELLTQKQLALPNGKTRLSAPEEACLRGFGPNSKVHRENIKMYRKIVEENQKALAKIRPTVQ